MGGTQNVDGQKKEGAHFSKKKGAHLSKHRADTYTCQGAALYTQSMIP